MRSPWPGIRRQGHEGSELPLAGLQTMGLPGTASPVGTEWGHLEIQAPHRWLETKLHCPSLLPRGGLGHEMVPMLSMQLSASPPIPPQVHLQPLHPPKSPLPAPEGSPPFRVQRSERPHPSIMGGSRLVASHPPTTVLLPPQMCPSLPSPCSLERYLQPQMLPFKSAGASLPSLLGRDRAPKP